MGLKWQAFLAVFLATLTLSMPAALAAAVTNYYGEALSNSTTTSTTYQDKITLTFTPNASKTHWVIASAVLNNASTTPDTYWRLRDDTAGSDFVETIFRMKDTGDYFSTFALAKYDSGASPPSTTFKTQFRNGSGATTINHKYATLIVLESGASDQYAESNTESTTTSTTYQDKTTLTFTPASQGDYLVIAFANFNSTTTTQSSTIRLDLDGTTQYGTADNYVPATAAYPCWGTMVNVNLTSASHTFKIQYKTSSGVSTAKIKNARIVAIRLDALNNAYYAEARSRSTTTSSTFQDKATLTQTPQAVAHLLLETQMFDGNSITTSAFRKFIEGAATQEDGQNEPSSTSAEIPQFWLVKKTLSASSTTWKTQYASNGSSTVGSSESAIALLQLEATPAGGATTPRRMLMGVGK